VLIGGASGPRSYTHAVSDEMGGASLEVDWFVQASDLHEEFARGWVTWPWGFTDEQAAEDFVKQEERRPATSSVGGSKEDVEFVANYQTWRVISAEELQREEGPEALAAARAAVHRIIP
jgi:hypothetical protein